MPLPKHQRHQLVVAERLGADPRQLLARPIHERSRSIAAGPFMVADRRAFRRCDALAEPALTYTRTRHASCAFAALALILAVLLAVGCAEPPSKEMNQAQGAIDAARAAGADKFATDEFNAAVDALERPNEAVAEGDYRLALNHALDSRERAQNAAKLAVDGRANARGDAERAIAEGRDALVARAKPG